MDCIPCLVCDCDGARYSYGEDANYLLEDHLIMNNGLERILVPIFQFKLFSGFKSATD